MGSPGEALGCGLVARTAVVLFALLPSGTIVNGQSAPQACPVPTFDADINSQVDLEDYAALQECLAGPSASMPTAPPRCRCFDVDSNLHVDLADFAAFLACFRVGVDGSSRTCIVTPAPNLRPDERVHLSVTALNALPANPMPGEVVDVAVTIHNDSEAIDVNAVVLELTLGNIEIAATRTDIAALETVVVHLDWMPDMTGLQVLRASIDPDEEFVDQNRLNNSRTYDVVVASAPVSGSEFAIESIEPPLTLGGYKGVQIVVRNNGPTESVAPLTFMAWDAAGLLVVSQSLLVAPIPPSEVATVEIAWPDGAQFGRHMATINPRFASLEVNPNDNTVGGDPAPVDLFVEAISIYQLKNDPLGFPMLSFRVVNGGSATVGAFRTQILNVQETGSAVVDTTGLSPGQSVYITVPIPTDPIEGGSPQFDIRITADSASAINETNEANNVSEVHFQWALPQVDRWVSIGPRVMEPHDGGSIGVLNSIAIAPPPKGSSTLTMYTTAAAYAAEPSQCGIWRSQNSGITWRPVGDSIPNSRFAACAVPPSSPTHVYAITMSGAVFKSEDSGTSWKQISSDAVNPRVSDGGALFFHPADSSKVYLTCTDGVRRSLDGGVTWQRMLGTGSESYATGLVMDPSNPDHLIAAVRGTSVTTAPSCSSSSPASGLYESFDGGTTWCNIFVCPGSDPFPALGDVSRISLAISGSHLFVSFREAERWTLFYTDEIGCFVGPDSGRTWRQGWTLTGNSAKAHWAGLYADPVDPNFLYSHGTRLKVSSDGGRTFHLPAVQAHADHHGFATDPRDHRTVYTACDGGIYKSVDNGENWAQIGHGITNSELYDIADAPSNPAIVLAGTQDNGNVKFDGASAVWMDVGLCQSGDGDIVEFDPLNENTTYIMGQYSDQLCKSTDGGPFLWFSQGLPGGCAHRRYLVHPLIPTTLLYPCGQLYRTTTNTPPGDWQPLPVPLVAGESIIVAAIDAGADLYYAGTNRGTIYAAVNGNNWSLVFAHPTATAVTDIEIDPDDPQTVYISFRGSTVRRIYRLRRPASVPAGTWSLAGASITSNLVQNETVQTIGVDRNDPLTILVGTNKSVHRGRSFDGGATWTWKPYRYGLSSALDVRDFEVHPTTGVIRAGTVGRGAFEVNTGPPIGSVLVAEGIVSSIRVHEVGSGFGPPGDVIDGEIVIKLNTWPGRAFGFSLRNDTDKRAHRGMLKLLRTAFKYDTRVRIDYVRTGLRNGLIIRVQDIQ
jgi:photosystem II stability/assembly factor-like uncharacterized protein